MLKRFSIFLCIALIGFCFTVEPSTAQASGCATQVQSSRRYEDNSISLGVSCEATSSTSQSGNAAGNSVVPVSSGCYRADGTEVDCWYQGYWWSATYNMYCRTWDLADDNSWWDVHRDAQGRPQGKYYLCRTFGMEPTTDAPIWEGDVTVTPPKSGTDPTTLIQSSLDTLGLHAPTVGVGAYVYPGYEEWGLSWWVGAPMWLWVDTTDPLQWGTHTLSASAWDLSATADVTPTSVTFDLGDGSDPVVCDNPGTPRPWDPTEPLRDHSPSGCEYTYMTTNELGNVDSRFTVTATVTWTVTWSSTDGQQGQFTTDMVSTDSASIHVGELRVVRVPTPT